MKKLILTENDVYQSPYGREIRGGSRKLYEAELAVLVKRDGSFEVIKDHVGLSNDEIRREIEGTPDNTILLAL